MNIAKFFVSSRDTNFPDISTLGISPWNPENLPGTTGIPRDVVREKDFSGIIISFYISEIFNYKNYSS